MITSDFAVPLLILRLGLGAFVLLFGVDKLVAPDVAATIYADFYGQDVSTILIYAAGVLEVVLGAVVLLGVWKTVSYGLALVLHAVSTLVTFQELLAPFGANHMFLAAVPVLAAFVTLFLLRRYDTCWSLGSERAGAG